MIASSLKTVAGRYAAALRWPRPSVRRSGKRAQRLYLHIGFPKTGTTTIQRTLYHNRAALRHVGFLYPETGLQWYGQHRLINAFSGDERPNWIAEEEPKALLGNLIDECRGFDGDVCLSSEAFSLADPGRVRDALADFDVRVVAFVRQQHDLADSWIRQRLRRTGHIETPDQALARLRERWFYGPLLEPWAEMFGDDGVVVAPIEQVTRNEGVHLASFFMDACQAPDPGLEFRDERANRKLTREVLDLSVALGVQAMNPAERSRLWRVLSQISAANPEAEIYRSIPSPDEKRQIWEHFQADNAHTAQRFMRPEWRRAFLDNQPPTRFAWAPWPGVTTERAFDLALEVIRRLLASST